MVLYLEALDQILRREVVLMECVRQVFQSWGFESPFDQEMIGSLSLARRQVRDLLDNGITEVGVPQKGRRGGPSGSGLDQGEGLN